MSSLQFARDDFGNRILPFPKGRGFCPVCEGVMVAKCGDIYRWHWQHVRDRNCDSWKEHETLWHRQWKEKFPAECREIIIQEDGDKHIADVLTKSGTVIEFQNSSISAGTILIREAFYGNMVWVVNAKSFSDNFTIRSTVKHKLWELDRDRVTDKRSNYDPGWDTSEFERKIKSLSHERDIYRQNADREQQILKKLEKAVDEIDLLVGQARSSWDNSSGMYFQVHGLSLISNNLKAGYTDRLAKMRKMKAELNGVEHTHASILNFESYNYQGREYKIVRFDDLKPELIDRCIIISKADKDTMFPTIHKFRSELDFHAYKYKVAEYLFAIDPAQTLDRLNANIKRLRCEYDTLEEEMPEYKVLLKERFVEHIQDELKLNKERYYSAVEKESDVQSKIYALEIKKAEYDDERQEEFDIYEAEEQRNYEAEKSRIMKTYKGKYSFIWKRERKSWSDASCPIYFDMGEDHLFERVSANSLVKVTKSDFLARHL